MHALLTPSATHPPRVFRWRVVDIVVASVVAVAAGVVFWVWGQVQNPLSGPVSAVLPGFQGLLNGPWLFAGVFTALIVRKPGAALYGELIAATVSALAGTQWGFATLLSGVVQGLGAELVFVLLFYTSWRFVPAILAGAGAGIAESVLDLLYWYPGAKPEFAVVYTITTTISGAVVAGLLSWSLVRAVAKTGALSRFAAGRDTGQPGASRR